MLLLAPIVGLSGLVAVTALGVALVSLAWASALVVSATITLIGLGLSKSLVRPLDARVAFAADIVQGKYARWAPLADLRHALQRQEFEVHYQPVVRLASNTVVEVEVLAVGGTLDVT